MTRHPFLTLILGFVAAAIIACAPVPTDAASLRFRGNGNSVTPPTGDCSKTGALALCQEGVAAGGLYFLAGQGQPNTEGGWASFSAYARQSGQTWAASEPDVNYGGIHYGIGPSILDSAMTNVTTITTGNPAFPGCSTYSATDLLLRCTATCAAPGDLVTYQNMYFNGPILELTNSGACKTRLQNITFKTNYDTCLYNHNGPSFIGSTLNIEIYNVKIDYSPECRPDAEFWGTPMSASVGLVQQAAWTGTIVDGGNFAPGLLTTTTGVTGRMSAEQYFDWPGRTIAATGTGSFTDVIQLLFRVRWMGKVTTSGSTVTIVSTDALSPSATPPGNSYISWGDHLNNANSRRGIYLTSCNSTTCTTAGASPNLPTPTDVIIGDQYCDGSDCNNAIWSVSAVPSSGDYTDAAMTSGPRNGGGLTFGNSGFPACTNFKSRFNLFRTANSWVTVAPCPTDIQGNAQEITSGHLGYFRNQEWAGSVGHLNGFASMQPGIGADGSISNYTEKYNVEVVTRRNVTGSITAPFSHFTVRSQQDYHLTWDNVDISDNIGVSNKSINNGKYDGGYSNQGGYHVKQLGQTINSIVTGLTGSITDDGDGTGTLHVTGGTGTANILVGDYIFCSGNPTCASYFTGPMKLTSQIATAPGDISTWKTSYYTAFTGVSRTIKRYVPEITTQNINRNIFDSTGFDGPVSLTNDVIVHSYTCADNKNLVTGATITGFGCN